MTQNPFENISYDESQYDLIVKPVTTIPEKIANFLFIFMLAIIFLFIVLKKQDAQLFFVIIFLWIACYFADYASRLRIFYVLNLSGIYLNPVGFIAWHHLQGAQRLIDGTIVCRLKEGYRMPTDNSNSTDRHNMRLVAIHTDPSPEDIIAYISHHIPFRDY